MARMKIEFLSHYHARHGLPAEGAAHRLAAALCAARFAAARLMNLRDRGCRGLAALSEKIAGFSARPLAPRLVQALEGDREASSPEAVIGDGRDVVLFGDTFNRYFETGKPRRPPPPVCWHGPGIACTGSRRRIAAVRSAAGAPFSPPARPMKRVWKRSVPVMRSSPCRARCARHSVSNPPACSPCATNSTRSCPTRPRRRSPDARLPVRGGARRRSGGGCDRPRLRRSGRTQGLSARALSSEELRSTQPPWRRCCGPCPASRSRPSNRAAAACRRLRLLMPAPSIPSLAMGELSALPPHSVKRNPMPSSSCRRHLVPPPDRGDGVLTRGRCIWRGSGTGWGVPEQRVFSSVDHDTGSPTVLRP